MYDTVEITKDQVFENEAELPKYESGNSNLVMHVIMVMAAFVGVWGTTCLISGFVGSSSLQELGRGLITAVTGM